MPKYKEGDIVKGKVTGIENYGFFLSLDGDYNGLVHISEMSDDFVKSIFDYIQLGETIQAKIIEVEGKKVKLSIKNFDYRLEGKKELEDLNGFTPLREKLPKWIEEYKEKNDLK